MDDRDFIIENGILIKYVSNMTSVRIPDGVTSIDMNAFDGTMVKELVIPGSVKTIGNYNYSGASYGQYYGNFPLENVTLLDGVEKIDKYAFKGYGKLKEVDCRSKNIKVEPLAFKNTNISVNI